MILVFNGIYKVVILELIRFNAARKCRRLVLTRVILNGNIRVSLDDISTYSKERGMDFLIIHRNSFNILARRHFLSHLIVVMFDLVTNAIVQPVELVRDHSDWTDQFADVDFKKTF